MKTSWVATTEARSGGPAVACYWSALPLLRRHCGDRRLSRPSHLVLASGKETCKGSNEDKEHSENSDVYSQRRCVCVSNLPHFSPCKHLFNFKKSLANGWWCCSQVIVAKPAPGLVHYRVMMALHLLVCYSIIVLLSQSAYWPEQNIIVSHFNFQIFKSISPLNWPSPIMTVFVIDFPGNITVWK